MSKRCYSRDHLWLEPDGSGMAKVGVTYYAQEELGDILFVELPEPETELVQGQSFGVAPASGKVVEANELLREEPWQVNDSPEGDGWILKIRCVEPNPCASLMDAEAYGELIGE